MSMDDVVTTLLDAAAMIGIAAGVGAASAEQVGWWGMAIGGAVLLGESLLVAALRARYPSEPR